MRLKELREEKGLTQDAIAKALGTTQTNIGRWEKCKNEPSSTMLILLADFFECTIDYLLGRSDDFGNIEIKEKDSPTLTVDEQQLLNDFRALPKPEQAQAVEYTHYLAEKQRIAKKKKA